jgi:hypothetical protein
MVDMPSEPRPSDRVVEQRMRNRAIEALQTLANGDEGVRAVGVDEFVEEFFDVIDDRAPWHWRTWSVFTADEVAALERVHDLLVEACEPPRRSASSGSIFGSPEDAFIRSGWPTRIQSAARTALGPMLRRGRFSEEHEEDEPSPSL